MDGNISFTSRQAAILTLFWTASAGVSVAVAQGHTDALVIATIAEVESTLTEHGRRAVKLVSADRVVPGDRVIYTLEARNSGTEAIAAPTITNPIPDHMRYIAGSAVGPGAVVSYSVDGGLSFEAAETLKVHSPDGQSRPAVAADYTHIRWQLKNSLKANSVAFMRFRAVVK